MRRDQICSIACGVLFLTACAPGSIQSGHTDPTTPGGAADPGAAVTNNPLHILYADANRGIAAIWDDGTEHLDLRASIDVQEGLVQSSIADHGRIVTRMLVPLGTATGLASQIGPLALAMSKDAALLPVDQAAQDRQRQLLPILAKALDELYVKTANLGSSSLRMALPWNEEVLARLVIGPMPGMDGEAACPELNSAVHTKLMHAPALTALLNGGHVAGGDRGIAQTMCNLGCAWYDVCCLHDQACVYCDHWWCGWSCVPGCFGGECGGGQ